MRKQKTNNLSLWLAIIGVAVLAVGSVSFAGGLGEKVINIYGNYIEASSDATLGGVNFEDEIFTQDVQIDGALTLTGALTTTGDTNLDILTTGNGTYISTTTDATTYTLVQADIEDYSYLNLDFTAGGAITHTLPATSTMMTLLPEIGSKREWIIHNASTTAVMTIAAGAGMNLLGIDTNVDTIAADGWASLECMQIVYSNNENIACMMEEYLVAD